mgnify:CR=1 FL=1
MLCIFHSVYDIIYYTTTLAEGQQNIENLYLFFTKKDIIIRIIYKNYTITERGVIRDDKNIVD